jgi:hypothetical protein
VAIPLRISFFSALCVAVAWPCRSPGDFGVSGTVPGRVDGLLSQPVVFPVHRGSRVGLSRLWAILLSDLWSSNLIELIRPISSRTTAFEHPYLFHCDSSADLFPFPGPFSDVRACGGVAVVLSTFVLGVHWILDIAAGIARSMVSMLLAQALDAKIVRGTTGLTWRPSHL